MTMVILEKPSRRERKKGAVRARIIATGIELFSRHGLDAVTVDHIADVADIGKGTVYNYFETKEDIVVAFMADIEAKIQAKIARMKWPSRSLDSILIEFLRFQFRLKKPYHRFVRVFLGQMFMRTEQFFPFMVEMQKVIDPPLETLFTKLQEHGLLRRSVNIPELILTFKTIHMGLSALWAVEGPPFRETDKVLRHEIKLFCKGLEATND